MPAENDKPDYIDDSEKVSPEGIKRAVKYLIYRDINNYLSQASEGLTETLEPAKTLFDNLSLLIDSLKSSLSSDYIILLMPADAGLDQLTVRAAVPSAAPDFFAPTYQVDEEAWNSLGQKRGVGVEIFTSNPSSLEKYNFDLPIVTNPTSEIVIIRVGDYAANIKFILIFARDVKSTKPTYRQDLRDVFDLLVVRLHEIYNLTLHRLRDLEYDRDRSRFIQDIMHQLTSSLSAIGTNVNRILLSGKTYEHEEALRRLQELVYSFQGYTQTFSLASSAEERSILDVYTEEFELFTGQDWVELIQRNCNSLVDKASYYKIDGPRLDYSSFETLSGVYIKPQLFNLVIFNILDNAVKYSKQDVNSPIRIFAEEQAGQITIHVVNHGIPLQQDNTDLIFERFFRSDEAQQHEPNGTGVGLYLCHQIVRLHDGSITVLPSAPSPQIPGAHEVTLTVQLPVAEVGVVQVKPQEPQQTTILCVEDEDWTHQAVIDTLRDHFDVRLARTASQALAILEKDHAAIKLILLDIRLKGGTKPLNPLAGDKGGIELARVILQEQAYDIPVIGITAYNSPQIGKEMLDLGVKKVLHRANTTLEDILETIEEYLE
jgi:signal transduction histidine kinase/CheY-like chemotaxis protein